MRTTEKPVCRYPLEIAAVKRRKQTLSIAAALEIPTDIINNKGEKILLPPMHMHSPYSRFVWTLVDISGAQKIYPNANIPSREVSVLKTLTDAMIIRNRLAVKPRNENVGPAYTTKIMVGKNFAGRTPASILLENGNDLEALLSTQQFLQERMDSQNGRFREGNQRQIDAIQEAVELYRAGKLSHDAIQGDEPVVVYYEPSKTLKNRPAKGDRYFTYSIKMECIPGLNYPWFVSIFNAYMKIEEKAGGTFQTIPGTAIDSSASRIQLSDYEFGGIIDRMYAAAQNFETVNFRRQFQEALRLDQEQREQRTVQYGQEDGDYRIAS